MSLESPYLRYLAGGFSLTICHFHGSTAFLASGWVVTWLDMYLRGSALRPGGGGCRTLRLPSRSLWILRRAPVKFLWPLRGLIRQMPSLLFEPPAPAWPSPSAPFPSESNAPNPDATAAASARRQRCLLLHREGAVP